MNTDARQHTADSFALPERYRIRRHVATGGMASVWCAEDLVLGRTVAVKVLAQRFAHDQLAMARFKREARAAARVSNHPHVVTVYDVGDLAPDPGSGEETGRAFIVMEYLAGGTVADALHHDSVRRHEAMRWLREAASALDHAHQRGIVHRDIKPANLLLDRNRVLHVTDFGIARLTTEDTITDADQLFGTAAYLSPEQALGQEASGASDRYALAVAAFELLAGERPFAAPHFSTQARQHIEEAPPAASELNRTLPPAVDEVLFDGLAKDPLQRPATAGAFVTALESALTEPASSRPGGHARSRTRAGAGRTRLIEPTAPPASTAAALLTNPPTLPPGAGGRGGDPLRPQPGTPRRRRRAVALTALLACGLLIAGIAAAAISNHDGHHAARTAAVVTHRSTTPAVTHTVSAATRRAAAARTAAAKQAAVLQLTGHQEMIAANYPEAISTLQKVVDTAAPSSKTYAYALYDLGRSMVLDGDPSAAIPILRQRLKIPNQTGTVKAELQVAIADATAQTAAQTETEPVDTTTTTTSSTSTTTTTSPSGFHSGGAGLLPGHPSSGPKGKKSKGSGAIEIVHLITAAAGR